MKEYEYSIKVKALKPYIDFVEKEKFLKIEDSTQVRTLYKSDNGIMARITKKENNNAFLDFKDDNDLEDVLKISRETMPLEITKENEKAIYSILNILGYKETKVLIRNRIVYKKDNIIFELDDYSSPEKMYVVAVEGEKNAVDKMYEKLKMTIKI